MSLFFETLFVANHQIRNLSYHNRRANRTVRENFSTNRSLDLKSAITLSKSPKRVKVIYSDRIERVEYHPIQKRVFRTFKVIDAHISYRYKYLDRQEIDQLFRTRGECDDIIISRDGLLQDTSIANITLFDGERWITPASPLLRGTVRESLIKKQIVLEKDVTIKDLKEAKAFAMMNAIVGFQRVKDPKFIIEG